MNRHSTLNFVVQAEAAYLGTVYLENLFKESKDIYAETASRMFNVPISEVTSDMRKSAKQVVFLNLYI